MTLLDLLPYILPYAKGCADITATFNARLAAIELCEKSMIWREHQTAIPSVAMQTAYLFAPAAGQQVSTLLSLTVDGADVTVVAPEAGKIFDEDGAIGPYAYGRLGGFELRPAQEAALPIVTYASVAPSLDAATLPDFFGRYAEAIAQGALARLLSSVDREYSNAAAAMKAQKQWDYAIDCAKSDAINGQARAVHRTRRVWF